MIISEKHWHGKFILEESTKQSEVQIGFEEPPEKGDASANEVEGRDQEAIDEQIRKCLEGPKQKRKRKVRCKLNRITVEPPYIEHPCVEPKMLNVERCSIIRGLFK